MSKPGQDGFGEQWGRKLGSSEASDNQMDSTALGSASASTPAFASSFSAFYPGSDPGASASSSGGGPHLSAEYPLFSARGPSSSQFVGIGSNDKPYPADSSTLASPPHHSGQPTPVASAPAGGSSLMPAFSSSKLRRESVLASNFDNDYDGNSQHGVQPAADDEMGSLSEDLDMEMDTAGTYAVTTSSGRLTLPMPLRPRSLSQSTSTRSPPFPSSPPRSQQHLLARMTSEQQQAMAASASSATSAHYLIPNSYRSSASFLVDDSTNGQSALDEEDEEEEVGTLLQDRPTVGSFNPLNPYSLKKPSSSFASQYRPDSRSSRDDAMEESPQPSLGGPRFPSVTRRSSEDHSISSESAEPASYSSSLRPSRSSPALSAAGAPKAKGKGKEGGVEDQFLSNSGNAVSQYGLGIPPAPTTPPPNGGLRRSQSANYKLAGLSSLTTSFPSFPSANTSLPPYMIAPHTAPLDGGSFPVRTRSSSFSGWGSASASASASIGPSATNSSGSDSGPVSGRSSDAAMAKMDEHNKGKARGPSASSGSDGGPPRVVRRAVNHKKGSLMPKSKDHLRIVSQLRLETGEFEVASEAALHRISQSTPALPAFISPKQNRSGSTSGTRPSNVPSQYAHSPFHLQYAPHAGNGSIGDGRPPSSSGKLPGAMMPVKNRFPETAVDDEDDDANDSSGSDFDYALGAEIASDTGMLDDEDNLSVGGAGYGDAQIQRSANSNLWTLRDSSNSYWNKPLTPGSKSTTEMDLSPSSALGWSGTTASRPGKRKMNDADRFEPYNYSAIKRRAVSPSTSSVSLSPLLTQANLSNLPLPPVANLPTLGPAANISATSSSSQINPQSQASPFSQGMPMGSGNWISRSRQSSPAPSLSSSAGTTRRWGNPSLNNNSSNSEEDRRNKVDLGKMSLG